MVIRWMSDPAHPKTTSLSLVSLERSRKGALDLAMAKGSGKILANHRKRREGRTFEVIINAERFEGVGTFRHQIYHRLDIFYETRYRDLGEAKAARELQQSIHGRADPADHGQVKMSGELW